MDTFRPRKNQDGLMSQRVEHWPDAVCIQIDNHHQGGVDGCSPPSVFERWLRVGARRLDHHRVLEEKTKDQVQQQVFGDRVWRLLQGVRDVL